MGRPFLHSAPPQEFLIVVLNLGSKLAGQSVSRSVGQLVSWSVGQLVRSSVGQLVSWSVDQLVSCMVDKCYGAWWINVTVQN